MRWVALGPHFALVRLARAKRECLAARSDKQWMQYIGTKTDARFSIRRATIATEISSFWNDLFGVIAIITIIIIAMECVLVYSQCHGYFIHRVDDSLNSLFFYPFFFCLVLLLSLYCYCDDFLCVVVWALCICSHLAKLVCEIVSLGKMRGNGFFSLRFVMSVYRNMGACLLCPYFKSMSREYVCLQIFHLLVLVIAIWICLFTEYHIE